LIADAERLVPAFEAAPYARRLGLRIGEVGGDAVRASVPYDDALANAQGFVHGGVAASLAIWTSLLVTVASDRSAPACSPVSASIQYLAAVREEELAATARVVSRGRDIAHVDVRVGGRTTPAVAAALTVVRALPALPAAAASFPPEPATTGSSGDPERGAVSAFSRAMGLVLRDESPQTVMTLRRDVNAGPAGTIDPGALVAASDTCAALACLPSISDRRRGSATLALSAVFGPAPARPAVVTGRQIAADGGIRSALVEVVGAGDRPALVASVTYRFVAAQ